MRTNPLRIGIDIGGTFTDFVVFDPANNRLKTFKLLSTPQEPEKAVLEGLEIILGKQSISENTTASRKANIIHGSTVATNALLERKGAMTALVTTQGFQDVIQIGRQNRAELYQLFIHQLPSLVPPELRLEVDERVDHEGNILATLQPVDVDNLVVRLQDLQVNSVAVCLLFSFLHPEHEQIIGERLRQAGYAVSLSAEILPEFREYERTSTTVVNAYVSPILDRYLSRLEEGIGQENNLMVMQSNGGSISPAEARREAVRCILSGPAGGVVGCEYVARMATSPADIRTHPGDQAPSGMGVLTFDMGGTSTDVSLIDGKPRITTEAVVSGCPIHIPLLDIHTIGAGGGSIAQVDPGGALRVGPESAGADPGPACYGRGDLPTVTDANVVLGRIPPEHFLGGRMPLDIDRATTALEPLAKTLHLSVEEIALGVIAVANAHMERALRVISVERGCDPRRFTLLSFGGAGGLHAADLARGLGISTVLVPPLASTLSAFGMLAAEVIKDYSLTVMLPGTTPIAELRSRLEPLTERGHTALRVEGVEEQAIHIEQTLDMRYQGQSYELLVPFSDSFLEIFHQLHETQYGYAKRNGTVEVVTLRVRAVGEVPPPPQEAEEYDGEDPGKAYLGARDVIFPQGTLRTPLFRGELLVPGNQLQGPAVIVRTDTTILFGSSDRARVDGYKNLFIEVGK